MAFGQTLLDGGLAFEPPVHGGVELVFVDGLDAEHLGEGVGCGVGGQFPRGSELGAWGEDARDDEGDGAFRRGGGGEGALEAQLAQRPEDCGDVAVGLGADDVETQTITLFMADWCGVEAMRRGHPSSHRDDLGRTICLSGNQDDT